MTPPWGTLGAGERRRALGEGRTLRLLTVAEQLAVRRRGSGPLTTNAALVALALEQDGATAYPSAQAVLDGLSHQEIETLARQWAELDGGENPSPTDPPDQVEALKAGLRGDPYARLRWRVLREFGALPSEKRAQAMLARDYLWCALNLLLDREEALDALCPACRAEGEGERCPVCGGHALRAQGENPSFDRTRYEKMKRGEAP